MPTPVSPVADHLPEQLADLAASIAHSVGIRVRQMREGGVSLTGTKSSPTDIVTAADEEAERLIVRALVEARPQDGILGEEGASREGTSGIVWVIDPIDGTVNYLYNIPAYSVSIAATVSAPGAFFDGRRAISGAVYNPVSDELFTAWEGGGARCNGSAIRISDHGDLATSLVSTGFGYMVEDRTLQADVAAKLLPRVRDIRSLGSCAYDMCLLASGRLDAYYESGVHAWDYAAAALIAQEAGAMLLGRDDDTPPGGPLLVAAAPALAPLLRAAVTP